MFSTILCDKVCQWLAIGWWFSPGTLGSAINMTDSHDVAEILLNVALYAIILTLNYGIVGLPTTNDNHKDEKRQWEKETNIFNEKLSYWG